MDRTAPTSTARTVVALGCFWRPDALFGAVEGVIRTCVGYAGGTTANPTYDALDDHIETVQVEYDPDQIDYTALLEHFWSAHDPTRAPFKRQYQSALLLRTEAQMKEARVSMAAVADRLDAPLTTEVIPDATFYRAEAYHQKHNLRRYSPLMKAFRAFYPGDEALADSPAAALVNGYAGGHRAPSHLVDDWPRLGLPAETADALQALVERRHS